MTAIDKLLNDRLNNCTLHRRNDILKAIDIGNYHKEIEDAFFNPGIKIPYNSYAIEVDNTTKHIFEIALAGYKKQDIKIVFKDAKTVQVQIKKQDNAKELNRTDFIRGIKYADFNFEFGITAVVDKDTIKSRFEDGILTIELQRKKDVHVVTEINID